MAIDDEVIGEAAGLGALAAVGAAAAPGLAAEALAAVGNAEGAVNEDFKFAIGLLADAGDFVEGEFAGEIDAGGAEALGEADAIDIGDGHLGAGVDGESGGDLADQGAGAEVLDDDGVGAGGGDRFDGLDGGLPFAVEDEGIEGDVALDAAAMEQGEGFGQLFESKADLGAGGEVREAEVDTVSTGFDGRLELGPVPGGAHDFGFINQRFLQTGHW